MGGAHFKRGCKKYAGCVLGKSADEVLMLLRATQSELDKIKSLANTFRGHFGLVYQDESKIVAVTDCISSYPVFYRKFDHVCNIATSAHALRYDCTMINRKQKLSCFLAILLVVALFSKRYHRLAMERYFSKWQSKRLRNFTIL